MSLAADVAAALPGLRAAAEALMQDAGVMRRPTGRMVQDPVSDQETEVYDDLFVSKCKIQIGGLQAAESETGERTAVTLRLELHLPITAPPVEVGDVWEMTAVGVLSDLQLLGRRFTVTSLFVKSLATARRLQVEEVVA